MVGQRPKRSLGLVGYPASQEHVARLAASLWGGDSRAEIKSRQVGKGRIIQDTTLERSWPRMACPRTWNCVVSRAISNSTGFIAKRMRMDIYFVANLSEASGQVEAAFRVSGKVPELWDPVTGDMRNLPEFQREEGRTVVPLEFAPKQSWFVVFQKPVGNASHAEGGKNFRRTLKVVRVDGPMGG